MDLLLLHLLWMLVWGEKEREEEVKVWRMCFAKLCEYALCNYII